MKLTAEVACDAGKAFADYRGGHLTDVVNAENFLYLAGDNYKENIHFSDGSYLERLFESGIWQVYSSQGRLLYEGEVMELAKFDAKKHDMGVVVIKTPGVERGLKVCFHNLVRETEFNEWVKARQDGRLVDSMFGLYEFEIRSLDAVLDKVIETQTAQAYSLTKEKIGINYQTEAEFKKAWRIIQKGARWIRRRHKVA